jgi:hypothetical protein
MKIAPFGSEKFLENSKEFLNSNSLIGKSVFLLLIILIFIGIFGILSRIIFYLLSPNENPYILNGMKSANNPLVITQSYANDNAIPIFRSKDQYDGIEFTYCFWMFIESSNLKNLQDNNKYAHVFHKGSFGSTSSNAGMEGIYDVNNSPGVYLYQGVDDAITDQLTDGTSLDSNYKILSMLIRLNIYRNSDSDENPNKYFEDIKIQGIPVKKWIHIVIRSTSQNIVDVYINGKVVKRHKLSNVIKQNYDNLYINMNGGFDGFLSNLKYYNYAIGTLEIENTVRNGPNLKMTESDTAIKSTPKYLSNSWYISESGVNY